ncbi:MAPEG family protein [uncultured Paraglaciecola sp.]|uniref:MAPEG family protein n=1 Tax=uncultured Paraglaciecola sp. TaxID=1765024 RepID=UPI0030DB25A6|tara:strand:- start:5532 stop:5951 length:420 start_codon:yes stop_codon:yes gene_type:complete
MNDTIIGLLGYITWTLMLLLWIAIYRTLLVTNKQKAPNAFKADGSDSPAFGQRLTRAQGNCVESFAFIGGLMLLALVTHSTAITNGLALVLLAARLGQSITHLLSTSVLAVQIRFVFFLGQIAICIYWVVLFAFKFIGV